MRGLGFLRSSVLSGFRGRYEDLSFKELFPDSVGTHFGLIWDDQENSTLVRVDETRGVLSETSGLLVLNVPVFGKEEGLRGSSFGSVAEGL